MNKRMKTLGRLLAAVTSLAILLSMTARNREMEQVVAEAVLVATPLRRPLRIPLRHRLRRRLRI